MMKKRTNSKSKISYGSKNEEHSRGIDHSQDPNIPKIMSHVEEPNTLLKIVANDRKIDDVTGNGFWLGIDQESQDMVRKNDDTL